MTKRTKPTKKPSKTPISTPTPTPTAAATTPSTLPSPPPTSPFTPTPTDPNLFTIYATNNRHSTPAEYFEQARLDEMQRRRDQVAQKRARKAKAAGLNKSGKDVSETRWAALIKRTVERVLIEDWRRW
ncbi:hypothetical protein FKW77_004527 [Venturia effusa]|uniref:Uncharacterized protein n=1 Tax=Venturia effusa TaxID=50376 RepID=A0A517KZD0_9PEZI|nr:hypothetical protein FKW77_004527 [Venturia effusa]